MDSTDAGLHPATPGYRLRPSFIEQIGDISDELGVDAEWYSDYWICVLRLNEEIVCRISGGYFPINTASAAQLANDKTATYEVLRGEGVAAVPHYLLRPQGRRAAECLREVLLRHRVPLVLKPNLESGGVDVYPSISERDLDQALRELVPRYRAISLSPFRKIYAETRVIVLDGVIRVAFEKVPDVGSTGIPGWSQHNLRLGAAVRLLETEQVRELANCALEACRVVGLRFASVDVITTEMGHEILEINSSVTLDRFSQCDSKNWELARGIYKDALVLTCGELGLV